jgi:hypothetical protein
MDTRHELQQVMWEVIAEMERARLQGDADQAQVLERIAWRLIEGVPGRFDCQIRKHQRSGYDPSRKFSGLAFMSCLY